jgi:type IV pilus assembly protein PilB
VSLAEPAPPPEGLTPPARRGGARRTLPEVLVAQRFATAEQVAEAEGRAGLAGPPAEQVLLDDGTITADQLARAVAERFGVDHLDLARFPVDMAAASAIPAALARRHRMVPVAELDRRTLLVAMADPADIMALEDVAIRTGRQVRVAVASPDDIAALVARLNRLDAALTEAVEEDAQQPREVTELRESAVDTPVIKLVNSLIAQAVEQRASDLHLEPDEQGLRVRTRIDGVLVETTRVPARMVPGVVSRIKIMADLDISERRLPQDGRVGLRVDGRPVDLRVVTLPSVHGESVVLRLLDQERVPLDLPALGMLERDRRRIERALARTHGAVMATGPTGAGKSTTLYAAVHLLNTPDRNVITIEDPVEYQLEGLTQMQVNPRAGLTFAAGLRASLRADPDVILLGEVRDRATAQIAVEAALTGHLVLTTLHTNDAATAVTRLLEMGIEPFLVASALACVVAQRLARLLCGHCKRPIRVPARSLEEQGFAARGDLDAFEPVGCPRCASSGYRGRIGLYELLEVTDEVRALALRRAPAGEIAAAGRSQGMRMLREDGLEKARLGLTSLDEVIRVTDAA